MSPADPEPSGIDPSVTEWATEAARSTILARRASQLCFVLAGVGAVLGVVGAVAISWSQWGSGDGDFTSPLGITVAQASNLLLSAVLPVGLLIAAGALLRLQAIRFETDLYASDSDADADADSDAGDTLETSQ